MNRKQDLMLFRKCITPESKICLAIQMPDGARELIVNDNANTKLDYIDKAYDDSLKLKTCGDIEIITWMIY